MFVLSFQPKMDVQVYIVIDFTGCKDTLNFMQKAKPISKVVELIIACLTSILLAEYINIL